MPVNDLWAELSPISSPKANNMTIVGLSGTQISTLFPTYPGQIVFCNTTSSPYLVNHWYGRNQLNDGWIDQTAIVMYDLFKSNATSVSVDRRNATKEMWFNLATGTGAAVNNNYVDASQGRIDLLSGTLTTSGAIIAIGGPLADFSRKMVLKVKVRTPSVITGQIVKIGVNVEKAGVAPTTTAQFGIEYCDGNANWQIHSASGTAQSNYDTLKPVVISTTSGFTIEYNPGINVNVYFDDAVIKTKITDIPSTGQSTEDGLIKISIINNNASVTSKTFQVIAAHLLYITNDNKWLQQP